MVPKRWSKIRPYYLCPYVPHVQALPVLMILSQILEVLYKPLYLEYSTKPTCVPRIAWYRQRRCFFPIWIFLKHLKSDELFCKRSTCKQKFPHNATKVFVDERLNIGSPKNEVKKVGSLYKILREKDNVLCEWEKENANGFVMCYWLLRTNYFLCQNLCEGVLFEIFSGL